MSPYQPTSRTTPIRRFGAAAQATIEARFAPAVIGVRYLQRLEAISTF